MLFTIMVGKGQTKTHLSHSYGIYIGSIDTSYSAYKDSTGWHIKNAGKALEAIIKSAQTTYSTYRAQIKAFNELLSTTQYNSVSGMFAPYNMRKKHFQALVKYWKITGQYEAAKKQYLKNSKTSIKKLSI